MSLHPERQTIKQFKLRLYGVLRVMTTTLEDATEMRITRKYTATLWERVWKNLHAAEAPDSVMSTWYQAIHDILPTNERLTAISLADTMLRALWKPRFAATWNRGLWRRPDDMALDQTNRCHSQNGPPTCIRDSASWFPTSASSKTGGSHMDSGSPGCLQPAVIKTPFFAWLHGLYEES
jgi:hypothetical protein